DPRTSSITVSMTKIQDTIATAFEFWFATQVQETSQDTRRQSPESSQFGLLMWHVQKSYQLHTFPDFSLHHYRTVETQMLEMLLKRRQGTSFDPVFRESF